MKVSGEGTVYPGKVGRSIATVGEGRTHRLSGICVISCHEQDLVPYRDREEVVRPGRRATWAWHRFIDMSGPGAILPYSSTINVCLTLKLKDGLNSSDRALVIDTASLRLSDTLAETTADLEPDSVETFDVSERDPSLPNVAAVILLASNEITTGPRSMSGSAIYGVTRAVGAVGAGSDRNARRRGGGGPHSRHLAAGQQPDRRRSVPTARQGPELRRVHHRQDQLGWRGGDESCPRTGRRRPRSSWAPTARSSPTT